MAVIDVYAMMAIHMSRMVAFALMLTNAVRQACVIMAHVLTWMDPSSASVMLDTPCLLVGRLVLVSSLIFFCDYMVLR